VNPENRNADVTVKIKVPPDTFPSELIILIPSIYEKTNKKTAIRKERYSAIVSMFGHTLSNIVACP
jgi:hypothetical protein